MSSLYNDQNTHTKIKIPNSFNISASNFNDNYFKFHDNIRTDGIIIDPILTTYMDMNNLNSDRTLHSKSEMNSFIESLSSDQFAKIQKFFNSMPRLQHEVEVENPKTKVKSKVKL